MEDRGTCDRTLDAVVTLSLAHGAANIHDRVARTVVGERLAALIGLPFAGHHEETGDHRHPYYVPLDTLNLSEARALGIGGPAQLMGGVVPHHFVATKAITHGLVSPHAVAPQGWRHDLASSLGEAVSSGFTAFSPEDMRIAVERLLTAGPVRLKTVAATAGLGQIVVETPDAADEAMAAQDAETIRRDGIVIEENLRNPVTYSVGTTVIGDHRIAYWGVQRLTSNNDDDIVYGGSDLHVVRGGFDALSDMPMDPAVATAVARAIAYDQAVFAAYPDAFASRRNYDVIEGIAADGRKKTGVLEQSWRPGGASGAEIAAFEAFAMDPDLHQVRSSTMEIYGRTNAAPDGATIYFDGIDPVAGPLTKFAMIQP